MQGSNIPNRRLLGSWNLPVRRMGLGDSAVIPLGYVALSPSDVAAFLARHPDIAAKVEQFENLILRFGYNLPGAYPIPEWGIGIADQDFHNVIIFPDAEGILRYTGNVPGSVTGETNKPRYISPPGDGPIPWTALLWIAGGLLALGVVNSVRPR